MSIQREIKFAAVYRMHKNPFKFATLKQILRCDLVY